jgi:hypothetical protein
LSNPEVKMPKLTRRSLLKKNKDALSAKELLPYETMYKYWERQYAFAKEVLASYKEYLQELKRTSRGIHNCFRNKHTEVCIPEEFQTTEDKVAFMERQMPFLKDRLDMLKAKRETIKREVHDAEKAKREVRHEERRQQKKNTTNGRSYARPSCKLSPIHEEDEPDEMMDPADSSDFLAELGLHQIRSWAIASCQEIDEPEEMEPEYCSDVLDELGLHQGRTIESRRPASRKLRVRWAANVQDNERGSSKNITKPAKRKSIWSKMRTFVIGR